MRVFLVLAFVGCGALRACATSMGAAPNGEETSSGGGFTDQGSFEAGPFVWPCDLVAGCDGGVVNVRLGDASITLGFGPAPASGCGLDWPSSSRACHVAGVEACGAPNGGAPCIFVGSYARPQHYVDTDGGSWRLLDGSLDLDLDADLDLAPPFYSGRFAARASPPGCDAASCEVDLTGDFTTCAYAPGPDRCR